MKGYFQWAHLNQILACCAHFTPITEFLNFIDLYCFFRYRRYIHIFQLLIAENSKNFFKTLPSKQILEIWQFFF